MGLDNFAHEHQFAKRGHDSWHANQLHLESSNQQIREYLIFDARRQRESAHSEGHYGRVEGDQWTPSDWDRIQEIRGELRSLCE